MAGTISKKYIQDLVVAHPDIPEDLRQIKRALATKYKTMIVTNALILKKYHKIIVKTIKINNQNHHFFNKFRLVNKQTY